MNKSQDKYLTHYAEQETSLLGDFPVNEIYQHVIVVPAYQEDAKFVQRFITSSLSTQKCLLIVVINQPDNAFGEANKDCQIALSHVIETFGNCCWQLENLKLIKLCDNVENSSINSSILIVDRFTSPINPDQGVGLARKVGADIAVALAAKKQIISPWIHSTDADAHLPDNYLSTHQIEALSDNIPSTENNLSTTSVASCCNFFHYSDEKQIHDANHLYETALRYYVEGLKYAKSPYAYFTIGSILSFKIAAYCQVRGFPKRSAGEDFYLLNKLAKQGGVAYLPNVIIKLDARPSGRVPFGTGPAVKNIMQLNKENEVYCYYHPQIFVELKACLIAFENLWYNRENHNLWSQQLSTINKSALVDIGLFHFVEKQKNANEKQFNKQLTVWFDSFKTLKFIHALRAKGLEDMALQQALIEAPFWLEVTDYNVIKSY